VARLQRVGQRALEVAVRLLQRLGLRRELGLLLLEPLGRLLQLGLLRLQLGGLRPQRLVALQGARPRAPRAPGWRRPATRRSAPRRRAPPAARP
jgi:hypothetical protein